MLNGFYFFNSDSRVSTERSADLLIQGLLLVMLGVLVALFPRLLLVIAASFFFLCGGFLIYLGYRIRKFQKDWQEVKVTLNDHWHQ